MIDRARCCVSCPVQCSRDVSTCNTGPASPVPCRGWRGGRMHRRRGSFALAGGTAAVQQPLCSLRRPASQWRSSHSESYSYIHTRGCRSDRYRSARGRVAGHAPPHSLTPQQQLPTHHVAAVAVPPPPPPPVIAATAAALRVVSNRISMRDHRMVCTCECFFRQPHRYDSDAAAG